MSRAAPARFPRCRLRRQRVSKASSIAHPRLGFAPDRASSRPRFISRVWLVRQFLNGAFQEIEVAFDFVPVARHFGRVSMVNERCVADAVFQSPFATADFEAAENLLVDAPDVKQTRRVAVKSRHIGTTIRLAAHVHDRQPPGHHGRIRSWPASIFQGHRRTIPRPHPA
jgi:hypothetical protein